MSIPEKKVCAKCKEEKLACDFYVKIRGLKRQQYLTPRCKKCDIEDKKKYRKPYDSNYFLTWKEKNKDKVKKYENKTYKKRKKIWEDFMKQQKCSKCGIADFRVLQWHHINPEEKTMTIGASAKIMNLNLVMEEVKKCICVCANCHFILHYEERESKDSQD